MMKTIAVIGSPEHLGSAIAERFAKAQYHVLLTDHRTKQPALSFRGLRFLFRKKRVKVPQVGIEIVASVKEASWEADIILLAAPYEAQAEVASKMKDVVTGKIIVSMVNPLNEFHDGLLTAPTTSAAEELATLLPHSKVVKAFNTIFTMDFEKLQFAAQALDIFVAGDDDEAVSTVAQLIRDVGLIPLYAGKLSMSRTLEGMMLLLDSVSTQNNYHVPIGWKVLRGTADEEHRKDTNNNSMRKAKLIEPK